MKHRIIKKETSKMSYLGIDFGKKKIGIAIAPEGILAVGYSIVYNDKSLIENLANIISSNEIGVIVVGLPISMSGKKSASTDLTLEFIEKIEKIFPNQKIFSYDERMTSQEARKNLPSQKFDDIEAARIILQGFLDKQKNLKL